MKKILALVLIVIGLYALVGCADTTSTTYVEEKVVELPPRFVFVDDIEPEYDIKPLSYVVDVVTRNVYVYTGKIKNYVASASYSQVGIFPLYDEDGNIEKYEGDLENLG